jgi:hypothetical protein
MSRDSFSFEPREEREPENSPKHDPRQRRSGGATRLTEPHRTPSDTRETENRTTTEQRKSETQDSPRAHYLGDRAYFLRDSELRTIAEVGTFRAIADADLARFGYGGDTARMEREVRRVQQQGLLSKRVVPAGRNKSMRLLALTKKGARLVRNSGRVPDEQALYHGFAKPREAKHDADLYRLYQVQAESIRAAGGRPARVILDYELKRELNRDLATMPTDEYAEQAREEIAARHGLAVVNGKIPLPDLRVEYETVDMEHRQLDLELATRNYRLRALAEKAKAGFALFALREDASRLRCVLDEREITAEILSL